MVRDVERIQFEVFSSFCRWERLVPQRSPLWSHKPLQLQICDSIRKQHILDEIVIVRHDPGHLQFNP